MISRGQGEHFRFWRRLWHDRSARVGLVLVLTLFLCAVLAPLLAPGDPSALGPAEASLQGDIQSLFRLEQRNRDHERFNQEKGQRNGSTISF